MIDTIPGAAPEPLAIQIVAPDGSPFGARFLGYTKTPPGRIRVGFPIAESLFDAKGQGTGKATGWRIADESLARILAASLSPALLAQRPEKVECSAVLSADKLYRYELARWWGTGPRLMLVMLNPSTADASKDDPTIRRCMTFALREGFNGIEVVNLFAFRTAYPRILRHEAELGVDIVGAENDEAINNAAARAAKGGRVVVAWGAGVTFGTKSRVPAFRGRDQHVLLLLREHGPVYRFKSPTSCPVPHPLMLAASTPMEQWKERAL